MVSWLSFLQRDNQLTTQLDLTLRSLKVIETGAIQKLGCGFKLQRNILDDLNQSIKQSEKD